MNFFNFLVRKLFLIRKVFFTQSYRRSYSQFGEDIEIQGIFRKRIKRGFFVDVGCYHPTKYNNTYRLYKRGWRGINIDMEPQKIEAFNILRRGDVNVLNAVSDKEGTVVAYLDRPYSVSSTISPDVAEDLMLKGPINKIEVQARTLNSIIADTPYANKAIDLLTIDCEGHDLNVIQSLDLAVYQPKLVLVETHDRVIKDVLKSPIHSFMEDNQYDLINWVGLTAFYARKGFYE